VLSPYTSQHLATLDGLKKQLEELGDAGRTELREMMGPYIAYREVAGRFFRDHLVGDCGRICFERDRSGCCGREGIIVFFADFVVELLAAGEERAEDFGRTLRADRGGTNCVYLSSKGCLWKIKPIACEMFLCDEVREKVLAADVDLDREWKDFREKEKEFTRPDKPVLFDDLERFFIEKGVESPLMYFHHSPGLLRMKRKHNVGRLERISIEP